MARILTQRRPRRRWLWGLLILAVIFGAVTASTGAYLSFFLDGATGGVIVTLQTVLFLLAFFFAPKHGRIAARRRALAEAEVR